MTTEAKIRNGIHVYLGAVISYKLLSYTIIDMPDWQKFIVVIGALGISAMLGALIELYQMIFLNQKVNWGDIGLTILGGLLGGLVSTTYHNLNFITTWLFYIALGICVLEIVRSQLSRIKLLKK